MCQTSRAEGGPWEGEEGARSEGETGARTGETMPLAGGGEWAWFLRAFSLLLPAVPSVLGSTRAPSLRAFAALPPSASWARLMGFCFS